ncbi:MAG: AEC family transporter [Lachnospiraceae bacterium]|nr:AEC family transporter [Lachnospiraceae bacterium]
MSSAFIILQQMLVLFGMMLVGYFCYKIDWIDNHTYGKLSKIVVNILNPLLVIDGVLGKNTGEDLNKLGINFGMMIIYFIFLIIISIPVAKIIRPEKKNVELYRLMMIFSNVGFMGIPVISALYGSGVIIYIVFYMLGYNFLLYTYGIILARRSAQRNSQRNENENGEKSTVSFKENIKSIMNPGVIAGILAIVLFVMNIQVAAPVASFIKYLSQCVVPMSMILIGASMAQHELKTIFNEIKMYWFLLIRLVIIPIAVALLVRQLPIDSQILGVFILMLAMPVGSIVVLVAMEQGADSSCCTKGSVVSTLLSIITIPIVAMLLP